MVLTFLCAGAQEEEQLVLRPDPEEHKDEAVDHRDPGGEHQEDSREEQQQGGGREQGRVWVQPPDGQDGLLCKPFRALTSVGGFPRRLSDKSS